MKINSTAIEEFEYCDVDYLNAPYGWIEAKLQQQIEDILTAIRKACPELMELTRNCEYRCKATKGSWYSHVLNTPTSFDRLCGCTNGRFTTRAFTTFKCGLCRKGKSWPNGLKPKWCLDCAGTRSVCPFCMAKIEIIGHEPHLEHLLRALNLPGDTRYETIVLQGSTLRIITPTRETETSIEEGVGINNEQYNTVTNDVWADITIDLTKSLRQNLENTDLREFIHSLLKV